ncbi:laccase 13 variant 1 [Marasmius tenuissimus]|uniref:Laccase 13 variant 1 n=1 Tax=Marasmius tenuissimus TaxID=585030 RepID=A0ABR2ZFN7_9AGAR
MYLRRLPFLAVALSTSIAQAQAQAATIRRKGDLHIVNKDISPDGFTRSSVLSNGEFPGPVITANKGEDLEITVFDELTDKRMDVLTSVHWHGIESRGRPFDDGTPSLTQCPIVPGKSFTYKVETGTQAGTFWYHSHFGAQFCDGLRGPLIIYDPNDPHKSLYDVDDESTIITLADWSVLFSLILFEYELIELDLQTRLHPLGTAHPYTLINGKGRYPGGPATPFSIVNVEQGKKPTILGCCESGPEGWQLLCAQVSFVQPRLPSLTSSPSNAKTKGIRANPNLPGIPGFANGTNLAILRYKGAPTADPTDSESKPNPNPKQLEERDLHPTENPGAPGKKEIDGADVNINMLLTFDQPGEKFFINGVSMTYPNVPVILQILSGQTDPTKLLPQGSVYELPRNKSIQLSFPTEDGSLAAPHPYHLHGHSFDVIRSAGSSAYNYDNPVRRDTVNIGMPGDNVTIRFRTDNTGPWIMHCHIARHAEVGLGVVLAEDIQGIQSNLKPDDAWNSLCPAYEEFIKSN